MYQPNIEIKDLAKLPDPKGYKILVGIPQVQQKTAGGIYIPDKVSDAEKTASIVGRVISMGSDAYQDPDKFPSGPWCHVGDWVIFRSYSGTRFKHDDQEFRLINDDTVEAVVNSPEEFKRA
jgi:chaperonin GroES